MFKNEDQEPESIANEDYRLEAITTLAEDFNTPGGPIHKKGASILLVANTKFKNKNLSFGLPSVSAMALNFSHKLWIESEKYLNDESNFTAPISKYMRTVELNPVDKSLFFDALEKRMGSIVFAYSALESFANKSITDDYIYKKEREDGKYTESYNREQVENYLSLDIKLDKILPEIFKVKSPKGKNLWNPYSNLKKLRNRIVHLKNDDTKSTAPDIKTIWTDLLNMNSLNYAVEAKKLIEYYHTHKGSKPRWIKKCPF